MIPWLTNQSLDGGGDSTESLLQHSSLQAQANTGDHCSLHYVEKQHTITTIFWSPRNFRKSENKGRHPRHTFHWQTTLHVLHKIVQFMTCKHTLYKYVSSESHGCGSCSVESIRIHVQISQPSLRLLTGVHRVTTFVLTSCRTCRKTMQVYHCRQYIAAKGRKWN